MSAAKGPPGVELLPALVVSIGTYGLGVLRHAVDAIVQRLGQVPGFLEFLALDTTAQSPRFSASFLPCDRHDRVSHRRSKIRRARSTVARGASVCEKRWSSPR